MTSQYPLETGKKTHKEITNMSFYARVLPKSILHIVKAIAYNLTNGSKGHKVVEPH